MPGTPLMLIFLARMPSSTTSNKLSFLFLSDPIFTTPTGMEGNIQRKYSALKASCKHQTLTGSLWVILLIALYAKCSPNLPIRNRKCVLLFIKNKIYIPSRNISLVFDISVGFYFGDIIRSDLYLISLGTNFTLKVFNNSCTFVSFVKV
jgi:hypothetical protein